MDWLSENEVISEKERASNGVGCVLPLSSGYSMNFRGGDSQTGFKFYLLAAWLCEPEHPVLLVALVFSLTKWD